MANPRRRIDDLPKVERDDKDELVILQSLSDTVIELRSSVRVLGFFFFCAVIIMAAMGYSQSQLSDKVDKVTDAATETQETASITRQQVESAIEELRQGDPEAAAELERVFQTIYRIEAIIIEEFGTP